MNDKLSFYVYDKDLLTGKVVLDKDTIYENECFLPEDTPYIFMQYPFENMDTAENIWKYLRGRCTPYDRKDIDLILEAMGISEYNYVDFLRFTHGVTPDDHIWFKFNDTKSDFSLMYSDVMSRGNGAKSIFPSNYKLAKEHLARSNGGISGLQDKYCAGRYWYKIDTSAREGLTEALVTKLLENSTLPTDRYVHYRLCKINGADGCRSMSFIRKYNSSFIPLGTLYLLAYGYPLSMSGFDVHEKVAKLMGIGYSIDVDMYEYLLTTFLLDLIILNRDRHLDNMGFIFDYDTRSFTTAPIFDNGLSLNTGLYSGACVHGVLGSLESLVSSMLSEGIKSLRYRLFGIETPESYLPFSVNVENVKECLKEYKSNEALVLGRQLDRYSFK